MIRVKMLLRNEVCIIDNGKTYIFNQSGMCVQEDAGLLPKYTTGMQDLPIISLLTSIGELEIATFDLGGERMRRFKSNSSDAFESALRIQGRGGFVRMLRRDGSANNIKFNQLLFIYPVGTNLDEIVKELDVKEVFD